MQVPLWRRRSGRVVAAMLAAFLPLTLGASGAGTEDVETSASVQTRVCIDADQRAIHFELRFGPGTSLRLFEDWFPWYSNRSIVLKVVRPDRFDGVLPEIRPVSDPDGAGVRVEGGTQLRGELRLDERFRTLAKVLRETDVVVFWAFRLRTTGGRSSDLAAGAFVLKRQGSVGNGQTDCVERLLHFKT